MRVFKLKYKGGRLSASWYYCFYWRGKKIKNRTLCSLRTNVSKD
jgi:hypothetical protein